jgi:hypothetical protein
VIWSDESSFTLFPTPGRVYIWRTPNEAYNQECLVTTEKYGGGFCDGLGSNIVVHYSVGLIITVHGQITAREYVDRLCNQMLPIIQKLFPKNDVVFQEDNAPFTQLELFGHGLKSMTVNFNIFLGQHSHQI